MKKISILAIAIVGVIALSTTPKKHYSLSEDEAIMTYNLCELFKKIAPQSDAISAKEAVAGMHVADSIQHRILIQYNDTLKKSK